MDRKPAPGARSGGCRAVDSTLRDVPMLTALTALAAAMLVAIHCTVRV